MTDLQSDGKSATAPTEAEVADYLTANPDFLQRRPELVRRLSPPSRFEAQEEGAEIVDMQGFMVSRLQADLARVQDNQDAMIRSARDNLTTQQQIHQAVLTMLEARDLEEFIHIVTRDLPILLDVDVLTICVERDGRFEPDHGGLFVLKPGEIEEVMGGEAAAERDVLLRERTFENDRLFGPAAALVRSDALVRLRLTGTAPQAMLALGSREEARFHPGQGTELLSFFAEAVARCLRRWLDLPPG